MPACVTPTTVASGRSRAPMLAVAAVTVLAAALLQVLLSGKAFLTDDHHHLVLAATVDGPEDVAALLWGARETAVRTYRPLVVLSFAASLAVAGPDAGRFLRHDLLLHALATFAVATYALRRRPEIGAIGAALIAGLFALHPCQLEVAAWSSARSCSLAIVLGFSSLHLLHGPRPRLALAAVAAFLALLAKDDAAVFLVPLALSGVGSRASPGGRRRVIAGVVVAVAVGAIWLGLRFAAFGDGFLDPASARPGDGIEGTARRFLHNFGQIVTGVPPQLVAAHGWPAHLAGWAMIAAWTALVLLALRRVASRGASAAGETPGLRKKARARRVLAGGREPLGLMVVAAGSLAVVSTVQQITPGFFNARMAYLVLAGALPLLAGAFVGPTGRTVGAALLATATAVTCAFAGSYVEGSRHIEAVYDALRGTMSRTGEVEEVLIVGYRDPGFAYGGFLGSTALEQAMQPPFTDRRRSVKIARTPGLDVPSPMSVAFDAFLRRHPHAAVVGPDLESARAGPWPDYEVYVSGRDPDAAQIPRSDAVAATTLRRDAAGEVLVLRFAGPVTPPVTAVELVAFTPFGRIPKLTVPVTPCAKDAPGDRRYYEIAVPVAAIPPHAGSAAWSVRLPGSAWHTPPALVPELRR